jgi:hypothetical protein
MPSKFPFLKSSTEPYGLLEQLGVAITLNPAEDAAQSGPGSWFGRLLEERDFLWLFQTADGREIERVEDREQLAESYLSENFRFTVFDWELLLLRITDDQGVLQGEVDLKGRSNLSGVEIRHDGQHTFECDIVRGDGQKWRVKRIVITEQGQRRDPARALSEVI